MAGEMAHEIKGRWSEEAAVAALSELAHAGADPDDPKEKKRRRIVEAAAALFVEQGYRKTSMDEIARRAHVAKGTLYLYAKTKADLLVQAIALEKLSRVDAWKPLWDPDKSPADKLAFLLESMLVLPEQLPLTARLLSGEREIVYVLQEFDPALLKQNEAESRQLFTGLIDAAAPGRFSAAELDAHAAALMAIGYTSMVLSEEHHRRGLDVAEQSRRIARMLVHGIVHDPEAGRDDARKSPRKTSRKRSSR